MIPLGLAAAGVLATVAALALCRPTLRHLAVRGALRRKGEAVLVVLGCALGTAIVTGSLLVGDTLEASLRARAASQLGPVDVVVRSFSATIGDGAETVLHFDPAPDADGTLGVVAADATLVASGGGPDERVVVPSVRLLETDFAQAAGFGRDPAATGIDGPTPKPGGVALGRDAAEELGVGPGATVEAFAYGRPLRLRVERVLPRLGVAGLAPGFDGGSLNAFVAPGTIAGLAYDARGLPKNARPPEHLLLVSATGGVFAGAERTDALVGQLQERLGTLVGYEIEPVKRDLLDSAREEGESFAELFLSLGAFAATAGAALLVNVLVMLAGERRRELGVMRALGMRRGDLVATFVIEGTIYATIAAAVGAVAGVGVARLMVLLANGVFSSAQRGGVTLELAVQVHTLFLGFLGGVAVSMAVVAATSLWISRMTVVEAVGGPDRRTQRRPRPGGLVAGALGAVAFLAASAYSIARGDPGGLAFPCLALACLASVVLGAYRRRPSPTPRRLVVSVAAVLAMSWAILSFGPLDLDGSDPTVFVVQGLVLTSAAVVLLAEHQERLGSALRRSGGRLGLVLRLGLAYPSARRLRTSLTLSTYALIAFVLVFSSVLSGVFSNEVGEAIADEAGGFDVLVSSSPADPIAARDLAASDGVRAVAPLYWTVAGFRVGSSGAFRDWAVSGFDRALLSGGPPALEEWDRSAYPSEAAVWEAVAADPELAIADVAFLQRGGGPPESNVAVGEWVEIQGPSGGAPSRCRIVAISSAGAAFSGVMVSRDSLARVFETPGGLAEASGEPVENRHYVAVSAGSDPEAVAADLQRQFLRNGVEARSFERVVRGALRDQEKFFDLIEGYLALGLLVGVAGLGVVTIRAVRERRRQIGVLRGLGFSASMVRAFVLVESGVVAVEGTLVGAGLALATSYGLITNSTTFGEAGAAFVVPWAQLAALLAGVVVASLVAALPSARSAAAAPPAAALRAAEEGAV